MEIVCSEVLKHADRREGSVGKRTEAAHKEEDSVVFRRRTPDAGPPLEVGVDSGPLTMLGKCVARRSGARPTSPAFIACVLLLCGTLGEWTVSFSRLRAFAT